MPISGLGLRLTVHKRWYYPALYAAGMGVVLVSAPFLSVYRIEKLIQWFACRLFKWGMYVKGEFYTDGPVGPKVA